MLQCKVCPHGSWAMKCSLVALQACHSSTATYYTLLYSDNNNNNNNDDDDDSNKHKINAVVQFLRESGDDITRIEDPLR